MRKVAAGEFGTAIWITADGKTLRAENHLESLVERSFDLPALKRRFGDFIMDAFAPEDGDVPSAFVQEGIFHGQEIPSELVHEFEYIEELTPLQIAEIPKIAEHLEYLSGADADPKITQILEQASQLLMNLIEQVSKNNFDDVVYGEIQPYHFAFQQGDIRIRLFGSAFVIELSGSQLNRHTAGQILDVFFSLTGGGKRVPPRIVLELWDFSGEPKSRSYEYRTMDEFFEGLSDLTRRVASRIDILLKLARIFYRATKEN